MSKATEQKSSHKTTSSAAKKGRGKKAVSEQLDMLAMAMPAPTKDHEDSSPPADSKLAAKTSADAAKPGQRKKAAPKRRSNAQEMAGRQRDISISEFFSKNRHLLGFDNLSKALLTTVREAVDNALDACEEAGIMPEIIVEIIEKAEDRYVVAIEDNGPGIVKAQLPKIFGKLLYGSKFHRLKQSRGQQGIGISAAAMYGQITTGRPVVIYSKTGAHRDAHRLEQQIDTSKNQPVVLRDELLSDNEYWNEKVSGTRVEIELQASFKGGQHSVDSYLRQTALANPHAHIIYRRPKGKEQRFVPVLGELPPESQEIMPHPHGVELGILMRMIKDARGRSIKEFLTGSFSRVSDRVAKQICAEAGVRPSASTAEVYKQSTEALYQAIQKTKIMAPPTNCLSPIGPDAIQRGMLALIQSGLAKDREVDVELLDEIVNSAETDPESGIETDGMFVTAVTRPPAVYRGNPFQVEVGIAYGKALPADQLAKVFRFANRVPLLYQQSACAMSKSVVQTGWRNYHVQQSRGALPTAPMIVMIHIASVWVPYTSESKEAIAHYPEILQELKRALQEAGRRLGRFLSRRRREADEAKKQKFIQKYIDPIGEALQELLALTDSQTQVATETLRDTLQRSRKM